MRVWILIDAYQFLAWMISGVAFMTLAYIFKFKSTTKNEELLLLDDNPWNDKETEDFLRHLKVEYLVFGYYISSIIVCWEVMFYAHGRGIGPKDTYPTVTIILMYGVQLVIDVSTFLYMMVTRANLRERKTKIKWFIISVIKLINIICMFVIFF